MDDQAAFEYARCYYVALAFLGDEAADECRARRIDALAQTIFDAVTDWRAEHPERELQKDDDPCF